MSLWFWFCLLAFSLLVVFAALRLAQFGWLQLPDISRNCYKAVASLGCQCPADCKTSSLPAVLQIQRRPQYSQLLGRRSPLKWGEPISCARHMAQCAGRKIQKGLENMMSCCYQWHKVCIQKPIHANSIPILSYIIRTFPFYIPHCRFSPQVITDGSCSSRAASPLQLPSSKGPSLLRKNWVKLGEQAKMDYPYYITIYITKKNPYGSPDLGNIWYGSMNCGLNLWKNSSCAMICTMDIHGMLRLLVRCSSWILPHGELQIHLLWAFLSCPGQRLGWRAWGKASYGCAKEKGDRVKTCKTLGFVFNTNHCFQKKALVEVAGACWYICVNIDMMQYPYDTPMSQDRLSIPGVIVSFLMSCGSYRTIICITQYLQKPLWVLHLGCITLIIIAY